MLLPQNHHRKHDLVAFMIWNNWNNYINNRLYKISKSKQNSRKFSKNQKAVIRQERNDFLSTQYKNNHIVYKKNSNWVCKIS